MPQAPSFEKTDYVIEINETLYKKIDKLIRILNAFDNRAHSKQSWILEAVNEKLNVEESSKKENIPVSKYLKLSMEVPLRKKIEDKVSLLKQFKNSYSTKKWLLEAIFEKLEREEYMAEKLIENFKLRESSKF